MTKTKVYQYRKDDNAPWVTYKTLAALKKANPDAKYKPINEGSNTKDNKTVTASDIKDKYNQGIGFKNVRFVDNPEMEKDDATVIKNRNTRDNVAEAKIYRMFFYKRLEYLYTNSIGKTLNFKNLKRLSKYLKVKVSKKKVERSEYPDIQLLPEIVLEENGTENVERSTISDLVEILKKTYPYLQRLSDNELEKFLKLSSRLNSFEARRGNDKSDLGLLKFKFSNTGNLLKGSGDDWVFKVNVSGKSITKESNVEKKGVTSRNVWMYIRIGNDLKLIGTKKDMKQAYDYMQIMDFKPNEERKSKTTLYRIIANKGIYTETGRYKYVVKENNRDIDKIVDADLILTRKGLETRKDLINDLKKYEQELVKGNMGKDFAINLNFKVDRRITMDNVNELLNLATYNLKRALSIKMGQPLDYNENKEVYRKFKVQLSLYDSAEYVMTKRRWVETPFLSYNEVLTDFEDRVKSALQRYDNSFIFNTVNLVFQYSEEMLSERLVFSSYKQTTYDVCKFLKTSNCDVKLDGYKLFSFDTRTLCFFKCVVLEVYFREWDKILDKYAIEDCPLDYIENLTFDKMLRKYKDFIDKGIDFAEDKSKKESRYTVNILEDLCKLAVNALKVNISVRFLLKDEVDNLDRWSEPVFKYEYGGEDIEDKDYIELVIFNTHCLLRRKDEPFNANPKHDDVYKLLKSLSCDCINADNLYYPSKLIKKIPRKEKEEEKETKHQRKKKKNEKMILTYDIETYNRETVKEKTVNGKSIKGKTRAVCYQIAYYDGNPDKKVHQFNSLKVKKEDHTDTVLIDFLNHIAANKKLKKGTHLMYAHNGGAFDSIILLTPIINGKIDNWHISEPISNGKIKTVTLTYKKDNYWVKLVLRDSKNHLQGSLAKLCESYATETKKLKGEVNHSEINIDNFNLQETVDLVKQYLDNDCVSLHEVITKYEKIIKEKFNVSIHDLLTSASLAKRIFMDYYNELDDVWLYTLSEQQENNHRENFYGGRNEVFGGLKHLKGKFKYMDFTSLYPFIMWLHEFYHGECEEVIYKKGHVGTQKTIPKLIKNGELFGYMVVLVKNNDKALKDNEYLSLLCSKIDGKLVFPKYKDQVIMLLDTQIVKYCLENDIGYEFEYLAAYKYEKKSRFFKDIIERVYDMKQAADEKIKEGLEKGDKDVEKKYECERKTAKIVINSLYGFFSQKLLNNRNFVIDENTSIAKMLKAQYIEQVGRLVDVGNLHKPNVKYFMYKKESNIFNDGSNPYNVSIASSVTQFARLYLFKLMKSIKEDGYNLHYCDTDSIITDHPFSKESKTWKEFCDPNKIGKDGESQFYKGLGILVNELENEGGEYVKEVVLNGCKFYALKYVNGKGEEKTSVKFKGLNIKAKYKKRILEKDVLVKVKKRVNGKIVTVEEKRDIVYLKELVQDGEKIDPKTILYSIDYDIMLLINHGWELNAESLQFFSGLKGSLIDDEGIMIDSSFVKMVNLGYTKAMKDEENNLIMYTIGNKIEDGKMDNEENQPDILEKMRELNTQIHIIEQTDKYTIRKDPNVSGVTRVTTKKVPKVSVLIKKRVTSV